MEAANSAPRFLRQTTKFIVFLVSVILVGFGQIPSARALVVQPYSEFCPLTVRSPPEPDISSVWRTGMRLDLRQRLGICPGDSGFPLFKPHFDEDELARIQAFIKTPEYRALVAAGHPAPYLVAKIKEFLKYDEEEIALAMLGAAWATEEPYPLKVPQQQHSAFYFQRAREHYASIAVGDPGSPRTAKARYLEIEISRRLGDFEAAAALLAKYEHDTPWLKAGITPAMLEQEVDLIRHAYSRVAMIGEAAPWNAPLVTFKIYPPRTSGLVQERIRIFFPDLRAKDLERGQMAAPIYDVYRHEEVPPEEAFPKDGSPSFIDAAEYELGLRDSGGTVFARTAAFYADPTLTRVDQYRYELCGALQRRTSEGAIEEIEVNDGGVITDIGGRAFDIVYDGNAFFLNDVTPDRPRVATAIEQGKGCRGTADAPKVVLYRKQER